MRWQLLPFWFESEKETVKIECIHSSLSIILVKIML